MEASKKYITVLILLAGLCAGQAYGQQNTNDWWGKLDKLNDKIISAVNRFNDGVCTIITKVTLTAEKTRTYPVVPFTNHRPAYAKTPSKVPCTNNSSKEMARETVRSLILGEGYCVSSGYGYRKDPFTNQTEFHHGIDLAAPAGTKVYSVENGTVVRTGYSETYGYYIVIGQGNRLMEKYAHLKEVFVYNGETVQKGEAIGEVGSTGRATGPHLHFELIVNNKRINPNQRYKF